MIPQRSSGGAWGDDTGNDNFLTMDAKSVSTQSLEIRSNSSSNHEPHHQSTNSLGGSLDQQLREHRDYIDDRLREIEERLVGQIPI